MKLPNLASLVPKSSKQSSEVSAFAFSVSWVIHLDILHGSLAMGAVLEAGRRLGGLQFVPELHQVRPSEVRDGLA